MIGFWISQPVTWLPCILLQLKSSFYGQVSTRLLVTGFNPSLPMVSSPSRNWRRGVNPRFHLIVFCLVWIKRTRRQREFKILLCNPVVETFFSGRVASRIPSNICGRTPLKKQPTTLTCWLLTQKSPTIDFRQDSKCGSNLRSCGCGVCLDCRCMELVVAGWCARKWLRLRQTIRNKKSYFW